MGRRGGGANATGRVRTVTGSTSQLVALYVETFGEVSIDTVCEDLDLRKLTVYSILPQLVEENRVERDGDTLRPVPDRE